MKRISLLVAACLLVSAMILSLGSYYTTEATSTEEVGLGTPAAPQDVKITLTDGTEIVALYYPSMLSGRKAPAALLLHQNAGKKEEWALLIPSLQEAGYAVLAVDQRGFGKTGGKTAYGLLEQDATEMIAWLASQPGIESGEIAIIGASVGANAALRACAALDSCKVVVALSPGLNFMGLQVEEVVTNMKGKSLLLISGQVDTESAKAVRTLGAVESLHNNVMTVLYARSGLHGAALLKNFKDLNTTIVHWLKTYNVVSQK